MKAVIALILSICLLTVAWAKPISKLIVFGDSLSDNGNSYEYTHHHTPAAPWYYLGRYSNGPIWMDYLSEKLFTEKPNQHVLNYAFGGAGALTTQGRSFTLSQEIDSYLLSHTFQADPDSLFMIWIGANDYLYHPQASEKDIQEVVFEIERNIHRLVENGVKNIMILSLPSLGYSPFARAVDLAQRFSKISETHNRLLKNMFLKMQEVYPNLHWIYFDTSPLWEKAMQKSQIFGLEYVQEACLQFTPKNSTEPKVNRESSSQCKNYMFFDQLHPTTWVHAMLADMVLKNLQTSRNDWRE